MTMLGYSSGVKRKERIRSPPEGQRMLDVRRYSHRDQTEMVWTHPGKGQ